MTVIWPRGYLIQHMSHATPGATPETPYIHVHHLTWVFVSIFPYFCTCHTCKDIFPPKIIVLIYVCSFCWKVGRERDSLNGDKENRISDQGFRAVFNIWPVLAFFCDFVLTFCLYLSLSLLRDTSSSYLCLIWQKIRKAVYPFYFYFLRKYYSQREPDFYLIWVHFGFGSILESQSCRQTIFWAHFWPIRGVLGPLC